MRKIILTLIPALCVTLATAQPPRGERPQPSAEEMQQRAEQRNAELHKILSLTDAVAHKVDSINAKYDLLLQEIRPARENRPEGRPAGGRGGAPGARPDDGYREKIQNLQKSRETEVKKHLSKEQQAKYDKWLKESQQQAPAPGGRRP